MRTATKSLQNAPLRMRILSHWHCQGKAQTSVNEVCHCVKMPTTKYKLCSENRKKMAKDPRKVTFKLYFYLFRWSASEFYCVSVQMVSKID